MRSLAPLQSGRYVLAEVSRHNAPSGPSTKMSEDFPLRPFLPADTVALRDLFAQSIEELTADDYDENQRLAWIATAEDAGEFAKRLGGMLTLVVQLDGIYLGFTSLKDNKTIEMLYVHPDYAGEGIGTALVDAVEKIAAARGAETLTADASNSAVTFFERLGYEQTSRNSVPIAEQWLSNTTMKKRLNPQQRYLDPAGETFMNKERLYLFDTTLRDGMQTTGVDFSLEDKRRLMRVLDDLGVDYIEGGYPGANATDTELFASTPRSQIGPFHGLRHDQARGPVGLERSRPASHPAVLG